MWASVDYPLYHSTYETFDAMKKFLDPTFSHHLALGRMWGWMGIALADAPLLPFAVADETIALRESVRQLELRYGPLLIKQGISLG